MRCTGRIPSWWGPGGEAPGSYEVLAGILEDCNGLNRNCDQFCHGKKCKKTAPSSGKEMARLGNQNPVRGQLDPCPPPQDADEGIFPTCPVPRPVPLSSFPYKNLQRFLHLKNFKKICRKFVQVFRKFEHNFQHGLLKKIIVECRGGGGGGLFPR